MPKKTIQENYEKQPLHGYQPAPSRLKLKQIFLKSTSELTTSLDHEQLQAWIALN